MTTPLISVIIPTFSRPENLARAIDSVLAQTYTNYEVIVVDDNGEGTENQIATESLLNTYVDSKVIYIKHAVNKNGAAARNTGIRVAQGELIAFLDDDDEWSKEKIEKQLEVIGDNVHNILIYCQAEVRTGTRQYISPQDSIGKGERMTDYLFVRKGLVQTSTIIVSRRLALSCLFDETLQRHQDYDFLFKLEFLEPDIFFIAKPMVKINWQNNNFKVRGQKGHTPKRSKQFALDRRASFSDLSYKLFILYNTVYYLIGCKMYWAALRDIFTNDLWGVFWEDILQRTLKK